MDVEKVSNREHDGVEGEKQIRQGWGESKQNARSTSQNCQRTNVNNKNDQNSKKRSSTGHLETTVLSR